MTACHSDLCAQAADSLRLVQAIPARLDVDYLRRMFEDAENAATLAASAIVVNRSCLRLLETTEDTLCDLRAVEKFVRGGESHA